MARTSLKNILGKTESRVLLDALINQLSAGTWIEDNNGKLISGIVGKNEFEFPVLLEDEVIGYVKGNAKSKTIADFLTCLGQKEAEKKKLGSEVLNLYQEINLIFNFSEKLAKMIDAPSICAITLNEASHVIKSDNGVIVLWDQSDQQLHVVASVGEQFFYSEKINSEVHLLSKI